VLRLMLVVLALVAVLDAVGAARCLKQELDLDCLGRRAIVVVQDDGACNGAEHET